MGRLRVYESGLITKIIGIKTMSLFHRHNRCFHNRWFVNLMARRFSKRLLLDSEQQQQLAKLQSVCADLQSSRESLFSDAESILKSEKLDRQAVLKMVQDPKQKLEERLADVVDGFTELFDNLDSEQRARLLQLWQSEHHCWL